MNAQRATLGVAFLFLGLLSLSCRQDENVTGPGPIAFAPVFTPGDQYLYEAYLTDEFGYIVPSTRTRASWRVLSTGTTAPGFASITTFQDSAIILRETPAVLDTVSIAVTPSGDVYRYGFLATMARVRRDPPPPDIWECIASFSSGVNNAWVVGYMDTARTRPVYGSIAGTTDLFTVNVKGQQMVFPAHRVDISGPQIEYSFWITDKPSGFLLFRLEPDGDRPGAQLTLTEIRERR